MMLDFLRLSGWASKAIVKIHWTGTVKNCSGDTLVTNWKPSKNYCNPGPGDGINSVQKSIFWCDNSVKKRLIVFATNDFFLNINHKIWLVLGSSWVDQCQKLLFVLDKLDTCVAKYIHMCFNSMIWHVVLCCGSRDQHWHRQTFKVRRTSFSFCYNLVTLHNSYVLSQKISDDE